MRGLLLGLFGRVFRSVKTRNFRLFFVGQSVSATGIWVQRVAELWLVLELTGSSIAVGFVTTLNFLPVLVLGAWGGLLADRMDKRRLLIVTQCLRAVPAFALAILTLSGVIEVWIVYVATFSTGVATAFDNPGRRAFVQEMVGRDLATNAVALNSTIMTMARIVGPAIAGVVIALVDIGWAFAINGMTYLAVVGSLVAMDASQLRRAVPTKRRPGQLREGFRYAWGNREVRSGLAMLALVATFAWGTLEVLIPLLVAFVFEGEAQAFAGLFSIMSVGSLIGSLSAAARSEVRLPHVAIAAVVLGVSLASLSLASVPWVAGVMLLPVGVAGAWFMASDNALVLIRSDDEYSGRVLALHSTLHLGGRSFGAVAIGWVASVVGPRGAFVVAGATAVVAGAPVLLRRSRASTERITSD